NQEAGGSGSAHKRTRTYIPREREEAEQRLIDDYFGDDETPPKYTEENFRRRYLEEYLRRPSLEDIEKTYALHEEKHGLPAMLGIIDCMHWDWKNCPKALHGKFKRRANNDLNVLYGSPLFDDVLAYTAPKAPFVVNEITYKKGYYLADGIYPAWSTSVKTFSIARDEKILKF
ncbi:zinc finger, CCHC-type containing protein, partial [Tanacetum coccineum]